MRQQRSSACRVRCAQGHAPSSRMGQDLAELSGSPPPPRFPLSTTRHTKLSLLRGSISPTTPSRVTHEHRFLPRHQKTAQCSQIMTTQKFSCDTKCCYLTGLYLENSTQLPCNSEYSSWDRSWDTQSPK